MLAELQDIIKNDLPRLLEDKSTLWNTLDVLYEDPHVERLWLQLGTRRLNLHRIYPCTKGFFHPHPWPSAVVILSGNYKMEVGANTPAGKRPDVAATMDLKAGSGYEMLSASGWHTVLPYGGPSLSVMLTGTPWRMPVMQHAHKAMNRPLTPEVRDELLEAFRTLLLPARRRPEPPAPVPLVASPPPP